MLKVGSVGFSVGRDRYLRSLPFVEAPTGLSLPKTETLAGWKADAPAGFEFAVQAHRLITHGPDDRAFPPSGRKLSKSRQLQCGAFRDSPEVAEAWRGTRAAAEVLGAKIVYFETPASFLPGPDRLRDMYRFFQALPRGRYSPVWRPMSREWSGKLLDKVCGDLGLVRAVDPLKEKPPRGRFLYLRPSLPPGGGLSVDNLSTITAAVDGATYVVLSHRAAFRDAERVQDAAAARR